ncbi:MAG: hypothetical protein J5X21_13120 [Candidatus Accumulibacter sp.]|jgi:hypothetical protein|nr:hypothetical protein [Candidatus Accumulibacter conexus]
MATMNFSVPDDVKESFNQTFANENKSAIVTRLLQEAVAQARRKAQSDAAFMRILVRRQQAPHVSSEEILQMRDDIRAESDSAHGIPGR